MEDGGFIPRFSRWIPMSVQRFLPIRSKWENWGTRKGPDPELSCVVQTSLGQGWAPRHEAMWHLQRAVQIGEWQ